MLVLALILPALTFANSTNVTNVYLHSGGHSLSLAKHAAPAALKGLVLYTPVGGKPGSGPQEFMGYNPRATVAPEPGRLLLLSTGLLGLGLFVRRKFARA